MFGLRCGRAVGGLVLAKGGAVNSMVDRVREPRHVVANPVAGGVLMACGCRIYTAQRTETTASEKNNAAFFLGADAVVRGQSCLTAPQWLDHALPYLTIPYLTSLACSLP